MERELGGGEVPPKRPKPIEIYPPKSQYRSCDCPASTRLLMASTRLLLASALRAIARTPGEPWRNLTPPASLHFPGNFPQPTGRRFLSMGWVELGGMGISTPKSSPSGLRPPPPPPSGGGNASFLQRFRQISHPSPFDGEGLGMGIPPSPYLIT